MTPELSRPLRLDEIGARPVRREFSADTAERAALAARFDLVRLDRLDAAFEIRAEAAGARITGRVTGGAVQSCGVSGLDVPAVIDEPVDLLAAAVAARPDEEVELSSADLDILPLDGDLIDLGEIAAETLGLALDPFPRASDDQLAAARAKLLDEDTAAAQAAEDSAARNPFRVLKGGKD